MGLYNPPDSFVEEMDYIFNTPYMGKESYHLKVEFNDKIKKWQIVQRIPDTKPVTIYTVQNSNGTYRKLDDRTIIKVRQLFYKTPDYMELDELVEKHNAKLAEDKKRDMANAVDGLTDNHWNEIRGIKQHAVGGIDNG